MPAKKARKPAKQLRKAKKLAATKPLTVVMSSGGDRPSEG